MLHFERNNTYKETRNTFIKDGKMDVSSTLDNWSELVTLLVGIRVGLVQYYRLDALIMAIKKIQLQ